MERNRTDLNRTELNTSFRTLIGEERRGESSGAFSRTLAMNGTQLCFLFVCVLFFLECSTGGGLWCILKTGLDDLWCRSSPILYMYCMSTAQVSRIERALFTDRRDDTRSTNAMHIGTLLIDRRGGDRQRGVLEIWIARCVRNANDQLSLIPSCPELCIIDSTRLDSSRPDDHLLLSLPPPPLPWPMDSKCSGPEDYSLGLYCSLEWLGSNRLVRIAWDQTFDDLAFCFVLYAPGRFGDFCCIRAVRCKYVYPTKLLINLLLTLISATGKIY